MFVCLCVGRTGETKGEGAKRGKEGGIIAIRAGRGKGAEQKRSVGQFRSGQIRKGNGIWKGESEGKIDMEGVRMGKKRGGRTHI